MSVASLQPESCWAIAKIGNGSAIGLGWIRSPMSDLPRSRAQDPDGGDNRKITGELIKAFIKPHLKVSLCTDRLL